MNITVEPTNLSDIVDLVNHMRESDKEEVLASHGFSPYHAAMYAYRTATDSCAFRVDGKLVAINGVAPLCGLPGGSPWMLATDDIEKYSRQFFRLTRDHVAAMLDSYGYLANFVHAKNTKSIKWLKWLGFTIYPVERYGAANEFFHKFDMMREVR